MRNVYVERIRFSDKAARDTAESVKSAVLNSLDDPNRIGRFIVKGVKEDEGKQFVIMLGVIYTHGSDVMVTNARFPAPLERDEAEDAWLIDATLIPCCPKLCGQCKVALSR
jgi:hypothetical protein